MLILKCQLCGNAYSCPPRNIGDTCKVNNCPGQLAFHSEVKLAQAKPRMFFLKCNKCGNVYSHPPRNIWDTCGVKGCTGVLDKA